MASGHVVWASHFRPSRWLDTSNTDAKLTKLFTGKCYHHVSSLAEAMDDKEAKVGGEEPSIPYREAKPPPSPQSEPKAEGLEWAVLATTATIEYFHTGNGADVLLPSPWAAAMAAEQGVDSRRGGLGSTDLPFVAPPDELSVSIFLEDDPDEIVATVAVPRWYSDGEVWEVRPTFPLF